VRLEANIDLRKKRLDGKATLRMTALRRSDSIRLDAVGLDIRF